MANGNVIELVVEAIDNASKVIAGVGSTIESVGKKSTQSMTPVAQATDLASQAFSKLKTAAAGVGVALGASQLFRKFIDEAGASEMAAVRLSLAYKNMGVQTGLTQTELNDFAATVQRTTTFTDEAVAGMQETLFRFGSITGDMFKRTQQVTVDLAAAMQTDLGSAAQLLGRALEAPTTGMRVLRQAGVIFSQSQKDLIKSLEETGQKAQAQSIILTELEKKYQGTAETVANTLQGALTQLSTAYDDLFESTDATASATTKMVQDMTAALQDPSVKESFDNLFALFAQLVKVVAGAVYGLGLLAGAIKSVFESPPQSKEVVAAWDEQTKAVAEYTNALNLINQIKANPAAFTLPGSKGPNMAGYEKRLAEAKVRVDAAQAKVNAAMAKDPFTQSEASKAAQERAAKIFADAEKKAADKARAAEEAAAAAKISNEARAKEARALSDAVMKDIFTFENALAGSSDKMFDPMKQYDEIFGPIRDRQDDIVARYKEAQVSVRTEVEATQAKYAQLLDAVQQYIDMVSKMPEGEDRSVKLNQAEESYARIAAARDKDVQAAREATDKMSLYAEQAAKNMQTAFADFLFDPFKGGLKGMLKGFLDTIRRMMAEQLSAKLFESSGVKNFIASMTGAAKPEATLAQAATSETTTAVTAVTNPLFDGLKSIFGPFITGIGSVFKGFLPMLSNVFSGLFNGLTSILGSIFGGGSSGSGIFGAILSIFGASAGGGTAKSNSFRVVGEAGPELVYTGTSGINVMNMRQMAFAGGNGGGGSVNYSPSNTIVIQGSADEKSRAEMMMMIQRNNQQQMVAINDMLYNNGMGRMR